MKICVVHYVVDKAVLCGLRMCHTFLVHSIALYNKTTTTTSITCRNILIAFKKYIHKNPRCENSLADNITKCKVIDATKSKIINIIHPTKLIYIHFMFNTLTRVLSRFNISTVLIYMYSEKPKKCVLHLVATTVNRFCCLNPHHPFADTTFI